MNEKNYQITQAFIKACKEGNIQEASRLLHDPDVNVNGKDNAMRITNRALASGKTALIAASVAGHAEIVKLLLNDPRVAFDMTAFSQACAYSNINVMTVFLHDDRISNALAEDGPNIRLKIACLTGDATQVSLLLSDEKIDINAQQNDNPIDQKTALYWACAANQLTIIALLLQDIRLDVNKPDMYQISPFFHACVHGKCDVATLLLEDYRLDFDHRNSEGMTPFMAACQSNHTEIVRLLMRDNRWNIKQTSNNRSTALHYACQAGAADIASLLLRHHGCNINAPNNSRRTPLCLACQTGNPKLVKMLLDHPAIQPALRSDDFFSVFASACKGGSLEVVKLLLDDARLPFPENKRDAQDNPSYFPALSCNHEQIILYLMDHPKFQEPATETAQGILLMACINGHATVVKRLLQNKKYAIELNKIWNGTTPFHLTCMNRRLELVRYFLQYPNLDLTIETNTGLDAFGLSCSLPDNEEMVLFLMQHPRMRQFVDANISKLWEAAFDYSYPKLMELLLNDPEMHKKYTEKKGTTPFFEVCRHGLLGTAKKILELHSVDINQKTPSGWTALCAAAAHGHTAVVEFLLDQSTLRWEPQKQETLDPLYAACMNRHPDVVKLLLKDRRLVLPQDPELLEKLKKLSEEISCWVDEIQHGEREGLEHHFRTMTITNTAKVAEEKNPSYHKKS